ncbi:MAG TPA: hypothetical protein VLL97_06710 [Acidobacteriota bacterium]|nr:hypothetical protein [Acidobacteriota bacterium]
MKSLAYFAISTAAALLTLAACPAPAAAQGMAPPVCAVVIHDEFTELENARIAVDLARSNFSAYEKIFSMIEGLWKARTIPRMDYLKARYDRDAAGLMLEEADLILRRQAALVEQYRLICGEATPGNEPRERAIRDAYLRYRSADCASLAKKIEIAETRLEFNREFLQRVLELRRDKFATNTQVILAQLDVEREEKSLADAQRRAAVCRAELAELENAATAAAGR